MLECEDTELVQRARHSDRAALQQLFVRYSGRVHAYALRSTGRGDLADDITQETFVRAFAKLDSFSGRATFRAWVFSIAVNQTRNAMRRSLSHPMEELPEDLSSDAPESTSWLRGRLRRALEELPEGYREVVLMHDVLQMPHEEIAELRACSVGTSKSQLHKGRARLRMRLKELYEPART